MACSACLLCFDFCSDLGDSRSRPAGFKRAEKATWQPKFKLAFIHPEGNRSFLGGGHRVADITTIEDPETGEKIAEIPTNFNLQP